MADNSVRTPGTGEDIRTVDKAGPKTQVVILDLGGSGTANLAAPSVVEDVAATADGTLWPVGAVRRNTPSVGTSADGDNAQLTVDALNRLWVQNGRLTVLDATQSGITTVTTAYTSGDVVGVVLTFTNFALQTGGAGLITGAVYQDDSDVMGAMDMFLFHTTVTTQGADNAAYAISDAENDTCRGVIQFPPPIDVGGARLGVVSGLSIPVHAAATSLFGVLVTRSANAVFAAGLSSLTFNLYVQQMG